MSSEGDQGAEDYILNAFRDDTAFQDLLRNKIFSDYFNTFLSLPIFAKRLLYRRDNGFFEIDPPVKRTTHHLLHDRVGTWTRINRAPIFLKTVICNEYRLCYHLHSTPIILKQEGMNEEEIGKYQKNSIGSVINMQRFKYYLNNSLGENLFKFWIDAERYRRQVPENCRRFVLKEIQEKFLSDSATYPLSLNIRQQAQKELTEEFDRRNSRREALPCTLLVATQQKVLRCLCEYWMPKYVQHRITRRQHILKRWGKAFNIKPEKDEDNHHDVLEIIETLKQRTKKMDQTREEGTDDEPARLHDGRHTSENKKDDTTLSSSEEDGVERRRFARQVYNLKRAQTSFEEKINDLTLWSHRRHKGNTLRVMDGNEDENGESESFFKLRIKSSAESSPLSTPTASRARFGSRTPKSRDALRLPPLDAPYADDQPSRSRQATLFEAIHVEAEYEGDTEEEAIIVRMRKESSNRLPLIDRLSSRNVSFIAGKIDINQSHARVYLPFDRSFLQQNKLHQTIESSRKFDLLNAALTTDQIAGQPLMEFIKRKRNYHSAEGDLKFWSAANKILTDHRCRNQPIARQKQYHVLIHLYLSHNSHLKVSLPQSTKDELCELLPKDTGVTKLMEARDEIANVLLPYWEEFLKNDEESFLMFATKCKRTSQLQNAVLENFHLIDDNQFDEDDLNRKTFEEMLQQKRNFLVRRMWRALELTMLICNERKPNVSSKKKEQESGSEDDDSDESDDDGGSLGVRYLQVVSKRAQYSQHQKDNQDTLLNQRGLTHDYNGGISLYQKDRDELTNDHKMNRTERSKETAQVPPRPRSFQEVLMEPSQFDYFKRFLLKEKEDTPLNFWSAVESMRTCKDAKARQARASGIVKRYFGAATNNGEMLKCNAEIIKEIAKAEKVTAAMLVSAQACVAKALEEDWFARYLSEFQSEGGVIGVAVLPAYTQVSTYTESVRTVKQKSRGLWRMFTKNVISFRRGITNKDTLKMFTDFLILQHKISLRTFQRNNTENPAANTNQSPPRIVINNKFVHIERLVADLNFWSEVERYKDFADAVVLCAKLGNYTKDDEIVVVKKACTIVDCFIDSQIPPKVQINISNELAENIINLVSNGIIERGLFHEAALSTFSTLIFYWKKFCLHRFLPIEKRPDSHKPPRNYRSQIIAAKQRAMRSNKMKKIALPPEDECPKIMFSLQLGIRLALNRNRRRKQGSSLDDDIFQSPTMTVSPEIYKRISIASALIV